MVTRPEKFLMRSVPPPRMAAVLSTRSVSCCSEAVTELENASAPASAIAGIKAIFSIFFPRRPFRREGPGKGSYAASDFQPPGVDRHPGHGVNADAVQPGDILLARHTTRGSDGASRRAAHPLDRLSIQSLHQSLDVDVGEQELAKVLLQLADCFDRRDRQLRSPSIDRDAPAARVDGRDQVVWRQRIGKLTGEPDVHEAARKSSEQRRADDHLACAPLEHRACTIE